MNLLDVITAPDPIRDHARSPEPESVSMPRIAIARPSPSLLQLLPAGVAATELRGGGDARELLPEEKNCIPHAAAKRMDDFAAGRQCARRALVELGLPARALLTQDDRRPHWPSSIVGSITHTEGFAAAIAARSDQVLSLGLDAEVVGQVSPDVWEEVFLPSERKFLQTLPEGERSLLATVLFSAREAYYKFQYALTQQWLDFQDVAVDVAGWTLGAGAFAVRPLKEIDLQRCLRTPVTGRFCFTGKWAVTAIAVPAL